MTKQTLEIEETTETESDVKYYAAGYVSHAVSNGFLTFGLGRSHAEALQDACERAPDAFTGTRKGLRGIALVEISEEGCAYIAKYYRRLLPPRFWKSLVTWVSIEEAIGTAASVPWGYIAWSAALAVWKDGGNPDDKRGRGRTPEKAIESACRQLGTGWNTTPDHLPKGLGMSTWNNSIDTIRVWAMYPCLTMNSERAVRYDELPAAEVKRMVSELYPGITPDHSQLPEIVIREMQSRGIEA